MDAAIGNLLTKLKGVTWTWSKASAEQAIASLGARLIQGVPGRSTYETPEGARLSLYSEGDLAEFVEITLEAFQDPHLLSEADYEQKTDEFLQKFRAAVATGTRILGPPAFNDPRWTPQIRPPRGRSKPATMEVAFEAIKVLPRGLLEMQVGAGLGAPALRPALEDVSVVQ